MAAPQPSKLKEEGSVRSGWCLACVGGASADLVACPPFSEVPCRVCAAALCAAFPLCVCITIASDGDKHYISTRCNASHA
eukprot:1558199-Rhodomonas_salina.1